MISPYLHLDVSLPVSGSFWSDWVCEHARLQAIRKRRRAGLLHFRPRSLGNHRGVLEPRNLLLDHQA